MLLKRQTYSICSLFSLFKAHYDIPKRRSIEIMAKCQIISTREIIYLIKHGKQTMKFLKEKITTRLGLKDKEPYMIRWNVFECRWFSIKIHKILLSDEVRLRDHSWSCLTRILKGGYVEESWKHRKKVYGSGSLLCRLASYAHRLEIYKPAITFVITIKKVQQWGFFTQKGWVEWSKYYPSKRCE